eukprot:GHVL01005830.1.p1 GENE.GHVL01005830.1~~GHVL01005830.1.p1  ORF type:complete len:264 (+),score=40.55 GHVL01005830.1:59-850(+)
MSELIDNFINFLQNKSFITYGSASLVSIGLFGIYKCISRLDIGIEFGKLNKSENKPSLYNSLGWILFESPNLIISSFSLYYIKNNNIKYNICIYIFILHYINRCIIYPIVKTYLFKKCSPMPIGIIMSAFSFTILNTTLQLSTWLNSSITTTSLSIGLPIFSLGLISNIWHDYRLLKLKSKSKSYIIPKGGLFEWISCPHYFSECIEWTGYAIILQGSIPALSFSLFSWLFLTGRAIQHHRWYKANFKDKYPIKRKAILPFLL